MMRVATLIRIVGATFLGLLVANVADSQPVSALALRTFVTVRAEVVAYEKFASEFYVINRAPTRIYVIHITKLVKGAEAESFVLISNRPTERRHTFLREVNDTEYRFKMKLMRSTSCDSSIKGLEEESSQTHKLASLKWVRSGIEIPPEKTLPCYILRDEDFKVVD